jgi:hypothetical protein
MAQTPNSIIHRWRLLLYSPFRLRSFPLLALGALIALVACRTSGSPEISEVLRQRRINRYELEVSGLSQLPHGTTIPEQGVGIKVYWLPSRPFVQDDFNYRVVVDSNKNLFWIIRFGGEGGMDTVFGPGNVTTASK